MKLGFGLYRHQLTRENFRFARQCGATHLVIHLVDYFRKRQGSAAVDNQPVDTGDGWGVTGDPNDPVWSRENLCRLQETAAEEGLTIYAIENFDPSMWHHILLDGPKKEEQARRIEQLLRDAAAAGIRVFGYNFSLAGVCGRTTRPVARGKAETVVIDGPDDRPLPPGMVWNMWYSLEGEAVGTAEISHDELWRRLEWFLKRLVPVAEEAGIRLAAHPDDPPFPRLRNTPRLVYQPHMYRRLLEIVPSPANALEFCLGTLAEMTEDDLYDITREFAEGGHLAYVHFRNIRGKVPYYEETFLDEGDIDMPRVLKILAECNYDGVLIPDHTPLMTCDAPWHAGMAYACGYMQALLQTLG
ncbi:mannonate dehydratase [Thermostilla marina]